MIENLPDDSAFQRERRDGDWSEAEYIQAAIVNEMRKLRADQAALHAGQKMEFDLVNSPAQRQAENELVDRHHDVREHIMDQLLGKKTK